MICVISSSKNSFNNQQEEHGIEIVQQLWQRVMTLGRKTFSVLWKPYGCLAFIFYQKYFL